MDDVRAARRGKKQDSGSLAAFGGTGSANLTVLVLMGGPSAEREVSLLSGRAVAKLVRSLGVLPEQVLVVYDCLDLALGRLRIRRRGSSGGHRGVDSIITELGSDAFARLRIGIGRPRGETLDHVLSAWQHDEAPLVEQVLETAAAAALLAVRRGVDVAMNTYNGWQAETLSADTDGN